MAQGKITGRTSGRARSTQAVNVGTARTGKARGKNIAGYGGRISSGSRGGTADQALNASAKALGRSAPGTGGASVGGVGGGGGDTTETTTGPGGTPGLPISSSPIPPLATFPGTDYPSPIGMKQPALSSSVEATPSFEPPPLLPTRGVKSDAVVSQPLNALGGALYGGTSSAKTGVDDVYRAPAPAIQTKANRVVSPGKKPTGAQRAKAKAATQTKANRVVSPGKKPTGAARKTTTTTKAPVKKATGGTTRKYAS
jgi:hypothetical protein